MLKCLNYIIALVTIATVANAQSGTGINTRTPNPFAFLHINETIGANKIKAGLIVPRYSSSEAGSIGTLTAGENGLLYFNKDNNCFTFWRQNTVSQPTGVWIDFCSLSSFYFTPNSSGATISPNPIGSGAVSGSVTLPITVNSNGTINAINITLNGITFTMAATSVTPSTTTLTINFSGTRTSVNNIYLPIKDNAGTILTYVFIPVI